MEKRWIPVVSLVLNVVLLVMLLLQGSRLEQLGRSTANDVASTMTQVQRLREQVDALQTQLREGEKLIADYSLEPTGLDMEAHALLADVALQLKEWAPDSAVTLTVSMDGTDAVQELAVDESGACRGQVSLPLDGYTGMSLAAQITSGGVTAWEDLGRWDGLSAMLPLRLSGTSASGPKYLGGALTGQVDICVETDGQAQVADPVFRVYLNGALAEELPAELSRSSSSTAGDCYAPATPEQELEVECSLGDTVEIKFFCRDSFGLGYEFAVANWTASAGGAPAPEPYAPGANPVLTWPE